PRRRRSRGDRRRSRGGCHLVGRAEALRAPQAHRQVGGSFPLGGPAHLVHAPGLPCIFALTAGRPLMFDALFVSFPGHVMLAGAALGLVFGVLMFVWMY